MQNKNKTQIMKKINTKKQTSLPFFTDWLSAGLFQLSQTYTEPRDWHKVKA